MPKVIDFGVAKATGGGLTDTELQIQAGAVVGTLDYMAPEQAGTTGEDIDTRADVYSLGVILYEQLTRTRPLDSQRMKGANLLEILRAIREEEPPPPSSRVAPAQARILASELDWIAMRCLEKDRARRYESASDLARDVQRYLADEPVEARPPSYGYRLGKYLQRNRVAVFTLTAVAASLVVGLGAAIWQAVLATEARNDAQFAASKERQAKDQAFQLANDNARLAEAANAANRETQKQFQRNRIVLFNSQMERVAQARESNPDLALQYFFDVEACPLDLRDMAWRWVERSESRRRLLSFLVQFSSTYPTSERVALSGDGSRLATAYLSTAPKPQQVIGTVTIYDRRTGQVTGTLPDFARMIGHLAFSARRAHAGRGGRRPPLSAARPRCGAVVGHDDVAETRQL